MHRADMVQVLLNNVPPSYPIHFGKKLLHYTEVLGDDGRIDHYVLHFTDGTTAEADVVIGADGIKSSVRMSMYDIAHRQDCSPDVEREQCSRCSAATPKWTGIITYRALIPTESLRKINPEHQAFRYTLCVSFMLHLGQEVPLTPARFLRLVLRKVQSEDFLCRNTDPLLTQSMAARRHLPRVTRQFHQLDRLQDKARDGRDCLRRQVG